MKKSIINYLGIAMGVALALTTSAFSKAKKAHNQDDMYTFEYNSSVSYTVAHVQDKSNWSYNASADECDDVNTKACTIQVFGASVDNPTTTPTLKSSFSIGTTSTGPLSSYVSSISNGDGTIVNRSDD